MDLTHIADTFATLQMGEPDDAWREAWPQTQASFAPDRLFFLEPRYVENSCRWLRMGDDVIAAYLHALDLFRANEALQRMAWHFHVSWFNPPAPDLKQTPSPMLPNTFGKETALFYGLVFLSGLPTLQRLHRERAVPEAITLDTLSDLERWTLKHHRREGQWGFSETGWMRIHFADRLYKLGRLQFEMGHFFPDFHVYRHNQTRRVLVLAGEGMRFGKNGLFTGPNAPDAWTAEYAVDEPRAIARGSVVSPWGKALNQRVELSLAEWTRIFGKGDPALSIHIPEAGPMDHAACGESFRQAVEFFPKHHPEFPFKGFMCFSWLLDRQYEDHLEPASNIVRFLQEYYLVPLEAFNPVGSFGHIFDGYSGDLDTAPERTALQRAVKKHLQAGGKWYTGGCVLFPEDLDWGRQVYRRQFEQHPLPTA
jgi:hypothetical protein